MKLIHVLHVWKDSSQKMQILITAMLVLMQTVNSVMIKTNVHLATISMEMKQKLMLIWKFVMNVILMDVNSALLMEYVMSVKQQIKKPTLIKMNVMNVILRIVIIVMKMVYVQNVKVLIFPMLILLLNAMIVA